MSEPQHTDFDDRAGFAAAVMKVLTLARRSIDIVDRNLQDWPLETRDGDDALLSALRRGVRMRLLVGEPERVARDGARLMRARRHFSARVECRCFPEWLRVVESALVVDGEHVVRRAHFDTLKGTCVIGSPPAAVPVRERIDAAWGESEPCLPASTLGL